jgi:RimJ/RimL family protein N-acetyltransferase
MDRWIKPITLTGKYASLEPMTMDHVMELGEASEDGELWKLWYTGVPSPQSVEGYVKSGLQMFEDRTAMPFVVREVSGDKNEHGKIIGSTRFCNIDEKNQRVEIGYTWYAKSYQRSPINTECKLMLLTHAFEQLEAIAVEFRTHWHNQASRRAIERLGAKQDGVLRNHQKMSDGSYRDTVVFSITDHEWLSVKNGLTFNLQRNN